MELLTGIFAVNSHGMCVNSFTIVVECVSSVSPPDENTSLMPVEGLKVFGRVDVSRAEHCRNELKQDEDAMENKQPRVRRFGDGGGGGHFYTARRDSIARMSEENSC